MKKILLTVLLIFGVLMGQDYGTIYTKTNAPLFRQPDERTGIIITVPKGEKCKVIYDQYFLTNYINVTYNGREGWLHINNVDIKSISLELYDASKYSIYYLKYYKDAFLENKSILGSVHTKDDGLTKLLKYPTPMSDAFIYMKAGSTCEVLFDKIPGGEYSSSTNYLFVSYNNMKGWVQISRLDINSFSSNLLRIIKYTTENDLHIKGDIIDDEGAIVEENIENNISVKIEPVNKQTKKELKTIANKTDISQADKKFQLTVKSLIDDSLSIINNQVNELVTNYNVLVDLKRNLFLSKMKNKGMSTFVYINSNKYPDIYQLINEKPFLYKEISYANHSSLYKVFPSRVTLSDGSQWILVEHIQGYKGFIDYEKVKEKLPIDFIAFIEDPHLDIYDEIKDINIKDLGSKDLDRWIEITSKVEDNKISKKSEKKINYFKMSKYFDLISIIIFITILYVQAIN